MAPTPVLLFYFPRRSMLGLRLKVTTSSCRVLPAMLKNSDGITVAYKL